MSGFTPGPWVYREFIGKYENKLGEIVTTKKKFSSIRIGNETVSIIGNYGLWSPKISEEVSNMKLIAAAPDLYEALSDLAVSVKARELYETLDTAEKADAVLAKARGES